MQSHQLQQVKKIILETKDAEVLQSLFRSLQRCDDPEAVDICSQLSNDNRPWIWWPAMSMAVRKAPDRLRPYDDWPEKMKLRLILTTGDLDDEQLRSKAYASLPELFTPDLARMNSQVWNDIRTMLMKRFDRKAVTETYINFLRQMNTEANQRFWLSDRMYENGSKWKICYIVRTFNVWYDVNIGNLGTDETGESWKAEPRNINQMKELIDKTLKWYEENKDLQPVEITFTGRVIDTAANPIKGADVNFTKLENYKDEKGHSRQRTVEMGTSITDAGGRFIFKDIPEGNAVTLDLNVSAEGFAPRNELPVSRMSDGRYQCLQDNTIVMQRPSSVSGKVIGPDGKPLAGADLQIFLNNHYSEPTRERNTKTDPEGNFRFDNITSGCHLVSFAKYRQVKLPISENARRTEYDGRCGGTFFLAKEARNVKDVVLDLSKSVCSMELEVLDPADKPVSDIALHFDVEAPKEPERGYENLGIFYANHENAGGIYKFEGLPQGKYRLRIYNRKFGTLPVDVDLTPEKTAKPKVKFKEK